MKLYIIILILIFNILTARADTSVTNTFVVDFDTTVSIVISGNLMTTIDATSGALDSGLNINYKITTNQSLTDIRLKALVVDELNVKHNAFYSTGGGSGSQNMYLVLASDEHKPPASSVEDCLKGTSTALNNPDAIAYPGTITINNNGLISYNSEGYYSCEIGENITDLNMSITTSPKAGTYDSSTAMDEPDPYKVEIYLDNIPS